VALAYPMAVAVLQGHCVACHCLQPTVHAYVALLPLLGSCTELAGDCTPVDTPVDTHAHTLPAAVVAAAAHTAAHTATQAD
jgi:hypothetical protein